MACGSSAGRPRRPSVVVSEAAVCKRNTYLDLTISTVYVSPPRVLQPRIQSARYRQKFKRIHPYLYRDNLYLYLRQHKSLLIQPFPLPTLSRRTAEVPVSRVHPWLFQRHLNTHRAPLPCQVKVSTIARLTPHSTGETASQASSNRDIVRSPISSLVPRT